MQSDPPSIKELSSYRAIELHRGQSLIELLVALGVGVLFIVAAVSIIAPALTINKNAGNAQTVAALSQELSDNIRAWKGSGWSNIANLATSSANHYYLNTSVSPFTAVSGDEFVAVGSNNYKRYFYVSDVYRDGSGNITSTISGNTYDPSTKQITISGAAVAYDGTIGNWTNTTALPNALDLHGAVVYNGYVYTTGGDIGSGWISTVYYAKFNSTGSISSWSTTTNSPIAVDDTGAFIYNGYIYMMGGSCSASNCSVGSGETSSVVYAPINANGLVGAWAATTQLPSALSDHAAFAYNGYAYVLGGADNNVVSNATATVIYAPISSNGTIGNWTNTTALPSPMHDHGAIVTNGYIYTVGGNISNSSNAQTSTVFYAPINSSGSVGAWATTTKMPSPLSVDSAVFANGYVYTISGEDSNGVATSSVFSAQINSTNLVGGWSRLPALPSVIIASNRAAVSYNGYLYTIGGDDSASIRTSTVRYAKMNSTILGSSFTTSFYLTRNQNNAYYENDWSGGPGQNGPATSTNNLFSTSTNIVYSRAGSITVQLNILSSTTPLPSAVFYNGAAVNNGYIYSLGGQNVAGGAITSTVYYSKPNADGTISNWSSTTPLPHSAISQRNVVNNGYIYSIGGFDSTVACCQVTSSVFYAKLNATGSISNWSSTASMLVSVEAFGAAVNNGYMYAVGGDNYVLTTSTAEFAPINGDGSLGNWSSTTAFPVSSDFFSVLPYNGYLNVWANGFPNNYYAMPNATGSVSNWSSTTQGPVYQGYVPVVASGSYAYVLGGGNNQAYGPVTYTLMNATGGFDTTWAPWPLVFPSNLGYNAGVAYNGYFYSLGGSSNGPISNVYYSATTLPTPPAVATGTLDSTTFDTGLSNGAQFNSIVWQGAKPGTSTVQFQLAVSNVSSGPWTFWGPDGTSNTYFGGSPATSISLLSSSNGYSLFNGNRYFRYRAVLTPTSIYSPTVNSVTVNWSP